MGTRAIYTFKGFNEAHHVFIHYDGYPSGAAEYFHKALESGKVWTLPRYEPDEFAAGFIAANKDGGGNVRMCSKRTAYCDVEYGYTVEPDKEIPSLLRLTVSETDFWGEKKKERRLWSGALVDFVSSGGDVVREA